MTKKRKSEKQSHVIFTPGKRARHEDESQRSIVDTRYHTLPQNGSSEILPSLPPIKPAMSTVVFTHQSVVPNKVNMNQSASYERLEFLGDAYVELIATRLIWDMFPDLPAGRLSQIRELLVKNETLGEIAVKYGLDEQIRVGADIKTKPKQWAKVKGDVIEAYVAAIVLDDNKMGGAGFTAAETWLHQLWVPKLDGVLGEKLPNLKAKDALSRKVMSRGVKLEYLEMRPMKQIQGGTQMYFMGAYITGWGYKAKLLGQGEGVNKTGAGNLAAENALQNPLIDEIAKKKREFDEMTKEPKEFVNVDDALVDRRTTQERMTREGGAS